MRPSAPLPPFSTRRTFFLHPLTFVLAISLLFALAACGGAAAPEETADPEPAEVQEVATEAQPTSAPPTATTLPEPTDTTVPPTEAPATEAPPEPAEEPVTTLVSGNCANPYFPVSEGRSLTYQTTDPSGGTTVYTMTYNDTSDGGFSVVYSMEGEAESFTMEWTCTPEGLLSPNLATMLGDLEGIEIEVVDASGITLPSADEMEVGASWTTTYNMTMTMSDETLGSMAMNQSIEMTSEIVGAESVTVPYGTFPDALRIESSGTVSMAIDMEGTPFPAQSFDMTSTTWYVEGIGMVREESPDIMGTGAGGSVTELVNVQEAP